MALQLRRGTDADRQGITPAAGEPVWATDTNKLFIGDGSTAGGVAVDTTAGISNVLEDTTPQLGGGLDLNNFDITGTGNINITGQISSTSMDLKGSIFGDDSTLLIDGVASTIPASNLIGTATINVTGDLTGNVIGSTIGTLSGSVFGDDSTVLVDGINNKIVGEVIGVVNTTAATITGSGGISDTARLEFIYDEAPLNNSVVLGTQRVMDRTQQKFVIQTRSSNTYISHHDSGTNGITLYDTHHVHGGLSVRIDPTNSVFSYPTNALEVVGAVSATRFIGDIQGSVIADDSTVIIDSTSGAIVNLAFTGEVGNTPADTGTVDSWLEVSVNGATKYIPLYD